MLLSLSNNFLFYFQLSVLNSHEYKLYLQAFFKHAIMSWKWQALVSIWRTLQCWGQVSADGMSSQIILCTSDPPIHYSADSFFFPKSYNFIYFLQQNFQNILSILRVLLYLFILSSFIFNQIKVLNRLLRFYCPFNVLMMQE